MSRKVTKVLAKKDATPAAQQQVEQTIIQFRNDFREATNGIDLAKIFNTDQSGFSPEHLSGRTLEIRGTKKVFSTIRSSHSASHQYTVQFMISAAGELVKPLFIILREINGVFGERVINTMFRHEEVYMQPSTNGKITKEILRLWFRDLYFPNTGDESVLLLDSLTTYRDRAAINREKPENQQYTVIIIPGGLTSYTQPLDVFFNRQYKAFFLIISDHIHTHHEEIKLNVRDTIIKMHVLTHNQFRSPLFQRFRQYSWKKAGLIGNIDEIGDADDENEDAWFFDPNEFCFDDMSLLQNPCSSCNVQPSFIRCAWCKQYLCFIHFYGENNENLHYCEDFQEQ